MYKSDLEKSRNRIEAKRRVEHGEERLKIGLVGINKKEGDPTLPQIERKTPVLGPALQSNQGFLCGLRRSRYRVGGRPDGKVVTTNRAAD